jgi:hypothetical protein
LGLGSTSMAIRSTLEARVLRNGTILAKVGDAQTFLERLPREQITTPVFFAGDALDKAITTGKVLDIEKARLELVRAFRSIGLL